MNKFEKTVLLILVAVVWCMIVLWILFALDLDFSKVPIYS